MFVNLQSIPLRRQSGSQPPLEFPFATVIALSLSRVSSLLQMTISRVRKFNMGFFGFKFGSGSFFLGGGGGEVEMGGWEWG